MAVDVLGAYVHGSLAMGCYYRAKSDLDVLVVVPSGLTPAERRHATRALAVLAADRPTTGDLELSVLTAAQAAAHEHPRPFEVHYSSYWTADVLADRLDYAESRADPDLAAHITVLLERGATVSGPPPSELFAPVPRRHYLKSILADVEDLDLLTNPYYGVLNTCRVLAALENGAVLSKDEGGAWGLDNLRPEHHPLISQALDCYRSARPVTEAERPTDGHAWDTAALLRFRDATTDQLR